LFEPAAVARDTSNDPEVPVCYVETFNIRSPRDFFYLKEHHVAIGTITYLDLFAMFWVVLWCVISSIM
jgi:hypothetical protein